MSDDGYHEITALRTRLAQLEGRLTRGARLDAVTHDLKTWPGQFAAVACGDKTHEVRKNDRGYRVGDVLNLREWSPETHEYSGKTCTRVVSHLTPGGVFGLPEDLCVMSVRELKR